MTCLGLSGYATGRPAHAAGNRYWRVALLGPGAFERAGLPAFRNAQCTAIAGEHLPVMTAPMWATAVALLGALSMDAPEELRVTRALEAVGAMYCARGATSTP